MFYIYFFKQSRLLRALNFVTAPSLFILDCSELKIISQAYTSLINDQNCENFPWQFTPPNELLKGNLLKNTNDGSFESVEFDKIGKGVKGLFFGAKWVFFFKYFTFICLNFLFLSAHLVNKC